MIARKLGQIVGKVVIIEATVAFGRSGQSRSLNLRIMSVVFGEMNKGMSGINDLSISHRWRVFRFGSKGLLMMESRMTERTFQDGESRVAYSRTPRILQAYFRKRAHSIIVESLLKDCHRVKLPRKGKIHVGVTLTVHSSSFQTSLRGNLSNCLSNGPCPSHNASNTGSSRFLQQHARLTAVPLPPDPTSSQAMSLTISSTLRQGCIESRKYIWPCTDDAWIRQQLTSNVRTALEVSQAVVATRWDT